MIEVGGRSRERVIADRVEDALGRSRAATGLAAVLRALERRTVGMLIVSEGSTRRAWLCPRCGSLVAAKGNCPNDRAALLEVDATDHLMREAAQQAVRVFIVRHEADWLATHGDFAAFLRPSGG